MHPSDRLSVRLRATVTTMAEKRENKGDMTVREAGRKGGEARFEELGPEGMSELGHKGGQKVKGLIEEGKSQERRR